MRTIRNVMAGFAIVAVLLWLISSFFIRSEPPHHSLPPTSACAKTCSLIVEPDDGIAPVLRMINGAKRSIDLVMYELEDGTIESALAAARKRGVAVRVLLSPGYQGEPSAVNEPAYDTLQTDDVAVRWTSDHFALTHEKSLVIDRREALIMSFNFVPKFYPTGRDFAIIDDEAKDVAAMEATFNNDWQGSGAAAPSGNDLVWSPGSRTSLIQLIDSADQTLDVYNEEMADPVVTSALIRAAARGVTVRVDMTYSPDWKAAFGNLVDHGVLVRTYSASAARYIHAKMIIVDDEKVFVGSENFSPTSLDQNRELGIMVENEGIISSLERVFENDWQDAAPFKKK